MHRDQTYLTASHSPGCVIFVIFLISRRNGENIFLSGVPLLPHVRSRALIPFPFPLERLPRRLITLVIIPTLWRSDTTKYFEFDGMYSSRNSSKNPRTKPFSLSAILAVVTLQTFYLGKQDLLTVYLY